MGIYIEEGKRGFTEDEITEIKEALKVWESVPTSYVCFRIAVYYQDPISLTTPDALPTISMYVTEQMILERMWNQILRQWMLEEGY